MLRELQRLYRSFTKRSYVWSSLIPLVVFIVDDALTHWHHYGRDSRLHVILENLAEDAGVLCVCAWLWWLDVWGNRPIPHWHCECPRCHHTWVMHPKHRVPACPCCGAPEPKLGAAGRPEAAG